MAGQQSIRWAVIAVLVAALSLMASGVLAFSTFLFQYQADSRDADRNRVSPVTLQTYAERGYFFHDGDKRKDVLLSLLPYDSISLERTMCFGDCPVYVVTFFKDGHATLVTDHLDGNGGKRYVGDLWVGDYVRLTQMVDLAKQVAAKDGYMAGWSDDYFAIIRAESRGGTWMVSDYGQVAPVEVWALETMLHVFKEHAKWLPANNR